MNRGTKALLFGGGATLAYALLSESTSSTFKPSGGSEGFVHHDVEGSGSGLQFARELPENPGQARDDMIVEAVESGSAMIRWTALSVSEAGHEATIPVMSRALQIGEPGSAWRVICSYNACQRIARHLSCVMLTPRVADLIFLSADVQLKPHNQPAWVTDGTMGKTFRSVEQSLLLDTIVPIDDAGLVANEGKQWVVSKRLFDPMGFDPIKWSAPEGVLGSRHNGPNYGWHMPGSGKPLQSVGLAHDRTHSDYSQMVQLMSRTIIVDGEELDIEEVLIDPVLSRLVSNEGPLPSAVHPDLMGVA